MARLPPKCQLIVSHVLKVAAKNGETTVKKCGDAAMVQIEKHIPQSYFRGWAREAVRNEVRMQMKRSLPMQVQAHLMKNIPDNLADAIDRLPSWIAIGDGKDAKRVPVIHASPEEWMLNYGLKFSKGMQTLEAADHSRDIGRYLQKMDAQSLGDLI